MRSLAVFFAGALALAACTGGTEPGDADVTIPGVDPEADGDLAPDATLRPDAGLAPDRTLQPDEGLAPADSLHASFPDTTRG